MKGIARIVSSANTAMTFTRPRIAKKNASGAKTDLSHQRTIFAKTAIIYMIKKKVENVKDANNMGILKMNAKSNVRIRNANILNPMYTRLKMENSTV